MIMKRRLMAAGLLALMLAAAPAAAQTLPSVEVFSPGLVQVSEALSAGAPVQMTASLTADNMLYARDLSVLTAMLSGTTFDYCGVGTLQDGADALSISRDGQELFSLALAYAPEGTQLTLNGETFALSRTAEQEQAAQWLDELGGAALLERMPLATVEAFLTGLAPGDALPGGFTVVQAFDVARTMSDDGERLTRLDISGSIARPGEEPWVIAGYLRQPGGRSPKDTFELTAVQDESNTLELSYSCTHTSNVTKRDKAGEMSVDVSFKVAGKVGGGKISSRLTVYLRNAWTADGENLNEKVTVNATLSHTDNTPGRRMQRLNDVSAKLRYVINMTTKESGGEPINLSDALTFSVVLDSNDFLSIAANIDAVVGGEAPVLPALPEATAGEATAAEAEASQSELDEAFSQAIAELARGLYALLSDGVREKIQTGL